jgi:DNA-binding SARP family transcriptional activator/tetratricopeptide (TPR) repeat protein
MHGPERESPRSNPNPVAAPVVEIGLLGGFSARCCGREIALKNRKTQALLACLALQDANSILRERLVGLIWSEVDEERARGSLRQAMYALREGLAAAGCDVVSADKMQVTLRRGAVSVDILEAIEMAGRREAHPVLLTQNEPIDSLLASFESIDPAFQSWIISKRKTLESQLVLRLETALGMEDRGDAEREKLARALVNVDSTNEVGVRHLMMARLGIGDDAGAMRAYKDLWNLLDEEFDTEPSKQTQELFARIKTMGPASPTETVTLAPESQIIAPPEPRPMISVSPIDTSGVRPEHNYLLHGFRRDLLSCLVRFREWLVKDGTHEGVVQAGDEYVVDTGANDTGDGISLVLMLREKRSGIYLWTERVKLATETWFEMQQFIVRRLAAALNVHVSNRRLQAIELAGEADMLAYDVWLRAQSEMTSWEETGWGRSEALLRDLIRRHPRFAPAYSNLSQLLNSVQFIKLGTWRSMAICNESISLATEATRLDPVDSRGHLALGWAYAMAGRHDRAAVHHEMACELNENDPWTLLSAGVGAAGRAEAVRAKELSGRAIELCVSPGAPHWFYLANIAYLNGDYETVLKTNEIAWSGVRYAEGWRIAALGNLGREAEAKRAMGHYVERLGAAWQGKHPPTRNHVAHWFLQLFPFSSEAAWSRLRTGLSVAGADVSQSRYESQGTPAS